MEKSRFPYNRLRTFRRCKGYSRKKVARMIGLASSSALSRWERGQAVPGIVQVFRLARIYCVLPHELYEGLWKHVDQEIETLAFNDEPLTNYQLSDE